MSDSILGFVSEPNNGRGTLSIIWSCLTTIAFVVWTILHPDTTRKILPRSLWALFVFLAPQCLPSGAIEQLVRARHLSTRLRVVPWWDAWTLKQLFLVTKQGVRLKSGAELRVLDARTLLDMAKLRNCQKRDKIVGHINASRSVPGTAALLAIL